MGIQAILLQKFKEKPQLITLMLGIIIVGAGLFNTVQGQISQQITSLDVQEKFYEAEIEELISLDIRGATIQEALRQVSDQVGVKLTYRGDIIGEKEKIGR